MEDTLATGNEKVPDEDDEIRDEHDREYGPEPIGTMGGDVLHAHSVRRVGLSAGTSVNADIRCDV